MASKLISKVPSKNKKVVAPKFSVVSRASTSVPAAKPPSIEALLQKVSSMTLKTPEVHHGSVSFDRPLSGAVLDCWQDLREKSEESYMRLSCAEPLPYFSATVFNVAATQEVYRYPSFTLHRDERLSLRVRAFSSCPDTWHETAHDGMSFRKPCAYYTRDPFVRPDDFPEFASISHLFFVPRDTVVFDVVVHRSILRLFEMSLVMREMVIFNNFRVDWFADQTCGFYAAGLVDFLGCGKSIFSFRARQLSSEPGSCPSLKLEKDGFYVRLAYSQDAPDEFSANVTYPLGTNPCFVHPVLDFYLQHPESRVGGSKVVCNPFYSHACSDVTNEFFVVCGEPLAAQLVRSSWQSWVVLVSGSFLWANYVTIHCQSRLYVSPSFAAVEALRLLMSFSTSLNVPPPLPTTVSLSEWKGEDFFTFPRVL